jgi:hypothetical protein
MSTSPWPPAGRLVAIDPGRTAEDMEPRAAAQLVTRALADQPSALLLHPSPRAKAILPHLPADAPLVAVLPDMPQLLRDVSNRGPVRAVLGRVAAGGVGAWSRLALAGLRHLSSLAAQDFRGIVPVLIELDRAGLGAVRPQGVALAAQLTDLLLAAGHRSCLAHIVEFLRRQGGAQAGFETLNLGHLLTRLAEWDIKPDFVIGPLNPRGFRMKPSPEAVLQAVRESRTPVLASEATAGGTVALADAIAHAERHGAAGVVLGLGDLRAAGGDDSAPGRPWAAGSGESR